LFVAARRSRLNVGAVGEPQQPWVVFMEQATLASFALCSRERLTFRGGHQ
jgi:hypothetical protein